MSFSRKLFSALVLAITLNVFSAERIPDEYRVGGFVVGCQAYTFKNFTVFEAIEKIAQSGGKTIEFFPRQAVSSDIKVIFNHTAPDDVIQKVKDKLTKHKIRAVNYGVVSVKDDAEWRQVFEFAKKMGLYAVTIENVADLDIIEKLVKEFDIRVAIHNHGRRPNDETYKIWDPNFILSSVKNRDMRIGACADTGHWATSGIKPIDGLKILRGRIISVHLKERAEIGELTTDCIFGTCATDTAGILDELKRQKFDGNISIEYETNWENSVPDVAQCVGFIRGWATGKK
jgi:sugar phosphate isomerase/epimerase